MENGNYYILRGYILGLYRGLGEKMDSTIQSLKFLGHGERKGIWQLLKSSGTNQDYTVQSTRS